MYSAAVITVSDKGSVGLREDSAGPAVQEILTEAGYQVVYTTIIPDEIDVIKNELIKLSDDKKTALVVTTGGTGFSKRDVTPEATIAVCEKLAPGIPEAMRAESLKITNRAILSRMAAGIRKETLIVNLPGSKKAAKENLLTVIPSLEHGLDILRDNKHDCGVEE